MSKDIGPVIRAAFHRAVKDMEKDQRPLSMLIRKELERRPIETIRALSPYALKESTVNVNKTVATNPKELTDGELQQLRSLAATLLGGAGDNAEGSGEIEPISVH